MKKVKNIINEILKYIFIFIITLCLLFCSLVLTAKIPKQAIKEKIEESAEYFNKNTGIKRIYNGREYTYLALYSDSILLNILYCIDSDHPIHSVLWDNFYENVQLNVNYDFVDLVQQNKEANQQYLRYWHGSMVILRPLFTILNIEQIYILNTVLLIILTIILLIMLWKKSKILSIIFLISLVMTNFSIVGINLEYTWTAYIMIITSIIAIIIEKKGDKGLYILFLISGMITCFLDFLTTEIITLFVPLLLVLIIRKNENRLKSFKEGIIFSIKCASLWGMGYFGMWFSKWLLAKIILNINVSQYILNNAALRISGLQGLESKAEMYIGAIVKNWYVLYPINIIKTPSHIIAVFIASVIIPILIIDWKNIKKQWFSALLFIIGLMPYVRYLLLANHSYRHAFYTFRIQIITIIALLYIVIECSWIKCVKKKSKNIQDKDQMNK